MGFYLQKDADNTLTINPDHTFLYVYYDLVGSLVKRIPIDSCHFITRGKWEFINNEIVLNSYDNLYVDTNRVRKILQMPAKSNKSNFTFKGIDENLLYFDRVDDEKGNFAQIIDRQFSDLDIELSKHKTMTFYLESYKPFTFTIKDTISANYIITLAPYYKQRFFNDKRFVVKSKRIKDKNLIFKKTIEQKMPPRSYKSGYTIYLR